MHDLNLQLLLGVSPMFLSIKLRVKLLLAMDKVETVYVESFVFPFSSSTRASLSEDMPHL